MKKDDIAKRFLKHFEKITEIRLKNRDRSLKPLFDALDDDFDEFCELVNDILYPEQVDASDVAEALKITRETLQDIVY